MKKSIQVSVSILCANFARLAEEMKKIEKAGADMVHVDVMDGHFVPPVTIGPLIVSALRPMTRLPIDVHLMVEHPETMIEDFVRAGADSLAVHAECFGALKPECQGFGQFPKEITALHSAQAKQAIAQIKKLGKQASMVINPGTDVRVLDPVLEDLDGILVMSVNPGFAHQKFMPSALAKVQYLKDHFRGEIAVDGGINDVTGPEAVKAGATILATASYFFGADDPAASVRILKHGQP